MEKVCFSQSLLYKPFGMRKEDEKVVINIIQ